MSQSQTHRRLAAIMVADVVGYSRLMGEDEAGTLNRINTLLRDRIEPLISDKNGRVVKLMGDGLLVEFPSVVDALQCGLEIQQSVSDAESGRPDSERIMFRMGINLGDIIAEGADIYGDGVNIAARLEGLADPGGVCINEPVRMAVENKLPVQYQDLGERKVKNIKTPLRVFRVVTEGEGAVDDPLPGKMPDLPDKPSIAVLPFTNMSGDPEQEYFGDGVSEDIITALSKVSSILVVARSSTFVYKNKQVDIRQVGREQGVRYVLEGSIRRSVNRIRVTAQLIDSLSGLHVWAERYDRELDDIFALQDEIMREIVVALDVELREGEQAKLWSKGTQNVEAWECVRLAATTIFGDSDRNLNQAKEFLERALSLDSSYAIAWVMMGWLYQNDVDVAAGLKADDARSARREAMRDCAETAIGLDSDCADAYSLMAMYFLELEDFDTAIENARMAIKLAPNNAEILGEAAVLLIKAGKASEGLELVKKKMRLCPLYRAGTLRTLAAGYRFTGNPEAAVDVYRESLKRQDDYLAPYVNLTSVLGELGRMDEAREAADEVLKFASDFSVSRYIEGLSYRNPEDLHRVENGLRRAGLPG